MEAIEQLSKLDIAGWVITSFFILSAIISAVKIIEEFSIIIGKPVKWIKTKNRDHELLVASVQELSELKDKQLEDTKQSIIHDKRIKDDLAVFMTEIRESVNDIKTEQSSIVLSVEKIVSSNQARDNAQMEEMCDRICQKTRHYINVIHGIPEDEYDDFIRLFKAYQGIHGNHGAEAKYNYCINHLPILPVEKKVTDQKN